MELDMLTKVTYNEIMTFDKITLSKMYLDDGLSSSEIATKYCVTVWQVINAMKKFGINRRTSSETQRLQFFRTPLSFSVKLNLNKKEAALKQAGLLLYWAEGAKSGGEVVDIANSDEKIVIIFLKMLREIYMVNENRIRVFLYSYANQNQDFLIEHWSKKLSIPKSNFTKPYIREDYKDNKINKMKYGLVHIRYNDKRLFEQIFKDIDILSKGLTDSS